MVRDTGAVVKLCRRSVSVDCGVMLKYGSATVPHVPGRCYLRRCVYWMQNAIFINEFVIYDVNK